MYYICTDFKTFFNVFYYFHVCQFLLFFLRKDTYHFWNLIFTSLHFLSSYSKSIFILLWAPSSHYFRSKLLIRISVYFKLFTMILVPAGQEGCPIVAGKLGRHSTVTEIARLPTHWGQRRHSRANNGKSITI